jgi:hypothetical protein
MKKVSALNQASSSLHATLRPRIHQKSHVLVHRDREEWQRAPDTARSTLHGSRLGSWLPKRIRSLLERVHGPCVRLTTA